MRPWYVAVRRRGSIDSAFALCQMTVVSLAALVVVAPDGLIPLGSANDLAISLALVVLLAIVGILHGGWEWVHYRGERRSSDEGQVSLANQYFGTSRVLERVCAGLFLVSSLYLYARLPWGSGDQLSIPVLGVSLAAFGGLSLVLLVALRSIVYVVEKSLSGLDR